MNELDPDSCNDPSRRLVNPRAGDDSCFAEATQLHQQGDVAQAESLYLTVLRHNPDHAGAWHLLGVALHQRGEHEAALDLIRRAISLDPQNAKFHNNYGAALLELGRAIEAMGCFCHALRLRPQYADAQANLQKAWTRFQTVQSPSGETSLSPDFPNGMRTDFTDEDLVFYLQVFQDYQLASGCLGNVKQHYPHSRVILLSDGDADPRIGQLATMYANVECVYGERLFLLRFGGAMMHRMLDVFFRRPAAYLLAIDTDTGIHRRFQHLPTRPGLFGSMQAIPAHDGGNLLSIQGGFTGFTLSAAARLFESACFLAPALAESNPSWVSNDFLKALVGQTGRVSQDWLTAHCATKIGLAMYDFPEVKSTWKHYVPNADQRYAITHPCKGGRL